MQGCAGKGADRGRDAGGSDEQSGDAKAKGALGFLSAQPDVQELARQRELAQANWLTTERAAVARGRAEGRAEALLALLQARGLSVPDEIRVRIRACTDPETLDRWIGRALAAQSAAERVGEN
jgi:hypothetical protein